MADTEEYRIPITADISELLSGFKEAGSAAEELSGKMEAAGNSGKEGLAELGEGAESANEKLHELSEGVNEHSEIIGKAVSGWKGLLEVMGVGGAAEVLNKVAETTMEVGDSMGITSAALTTGINEARGFNEAMESLGVSSGAAAGAVRRMQTDVESGGKHLAQLGITMDDVKSKYSDGISLFEAVIDRLNDMAPSVERNAVAYNLLGRGGMQLMAVLSDVNGTIEKNVEEQQQNNAVNKTANDNALILHSTLTQLNSMWEDISIKMSGVVADSFKELKDDAKELWDEIQTLWNILQTIRDGAEAVGRAIRESIGNAFQWVADQAHRAAIAAEEFWSRMKSLHHEIAVRLGREDKGAPFGYMGEGGAGDISGYGPGYAHPGTESGIVDIPGYGPGPAPLAGRGGKKGGGGDVEDANQMANALQKADQTLEKMTNDYNKLGSESAMAAKASTESYSELAARAKDDFAKMQDAHQKLVEAIESGSKKAAKEAADAFHLFQQKFQEDWDAARAKAVEDMKQIKQEADAMASEVSGILNNAISGKLNWAEEFNKILQKMADMLVKHLFEQVAKWAANEATVNAIKATGAAQGVAIQKAADNQAGASSAVTAAKGAYASASQIPYIGWLLGPIAAAAAFAGVEAFGSAEGGFDIPPGLSPITQLHPREMVLPASLADTIRSANFGSGGSSAHLNITQNVSAIDSQSFAETLDIGRRAVASSLGAAMRGGMMLNTGG